jgi:hypothetical protein
MPHARAAAGRAVAMGEADRRRACVRACRDGKGFTLHQLREFTSFFMMHYLVSALTREIP